MKENYEKALSVVLEFEGGYVDDPDDLGGITCFGITRKNHPNLEMWEVIDHLKKIGIHPKYIAGRAKEYTQVINSIGEVYKKQYWDACKCDKLPNGIDIYVFDGAVNHGVKQSSKFLQKAVKATPDGVIGNQTLSAVKKENPATVKSKILSLRRAFYDDLIKRHPEQEKFRKGWYNRLDKLAKI